ENPARERPRPDRQRHAAHLQLRGGGALPFGGGGPADDDRLPVQPGRARQGELRDLQRRGRRRDRRALSPAAHDDAARDRQEGDAGTTGGGGGGRAGGQVDQP